MLLIVLLFICVFPILLQNTHRPSVNSEIVSVYECVDRGKLADNLWTCDRLFNFSCSCTAFLVLRRVAMAIWTIADEFLVVLFVSVEILTAG